MQIKLNNNQYYYRATCNYEQGGFPAKFACDKGFVGFYAEPDSSIFKKHLELLIKYNTNNCSSRDGWELIIERFDSEEHADIHCECAHILVALDGNVSVEDRYFYQSCIDQLTNGKHSEDDLKNMLKQTLRYFIDNEGKLKIIGDK